MADQKDSFGLYTACQNISRDIRGDFGGGSPIPKTFLMAYLVHAEGLEKFLEIGVYRGKSLFPTAYSIYLNGGFSVGVDPYSTEDAREKDVSKDLRKEIDSFLDGLDFDEIYRDVLEYREKCDFGDSIKIARKTSADFFADRTTSDERFDIAHIDGNHDTRFVREDYYGCLNVLNEGGYIVFDDIDWNSVRSVYDEAKQKSPVVFECDQFGILLNQAPSITRDLHVEKLSKKLHAAYKRVVALESLPDRYIPTVSVGILAYNQVEYIEECLESVFSQTGAFNLKVVIGDDSSNDGTSEKIRQAISERIDTEHLKVEYYRNDNNIGMVRNFQKLIARLGDSDYFTFCEGDDYYLSQTRISEHIELHRTCPQFSITFNRLLTYHQDDGRYEVFEPAFKGKEVSTEELAKENVIGNLNSAFYNSSLLDYIKPDLFEKMFTGDWMLALYLSQYGDVGLLNKPFNVYRKHGGGIWTGKDEEIKRSLLLDSIDSYNRYLNFSYDNYFSHYKKLLHSQDNTLGLEKESVTIIDDISPHPISGFRYEEFTTILRKIPRSKLLTTGESTHILGPDSIAALIIDYKRSHPDLANSVAILRSDEQTHSSLLYCDFLGNAYANVVSRAEQEQTPFVFTLYPGGMFALYNDNSDAMLRRVMNSPYFYKVIVTQKIAYDYLVKNGFCAEEKIEYIWGVVVPSEKLNLQTPKQHYGIDKKTIDICFVAHKYSERGQDKGYDIFLEVARTLSKEYRQVRFHVVGPWDKNVLSVAGISNIKYYGVQKQDWFDRFYRDKDIILSPNIDNQINGGSFDGFPTGAVTDASLRKVAMFVTDPLKLNEGRFKNGEEIVLVKHDVNDIVKKISYYINNPNKLRRVAERGYNKSNTLYSFNKQMKPRLDLLRYAIKNAHPEATPPQPIPDSVYSSFIYNYIKRRMPPKAKRLIGTCCRRVGLRFP